MEYQLFFVSEQQAIFLNNLFGDRFNKWGKMHVNGIEFTQTIKISNKEAIAKQYATYPDSHLVYVGYLSHIKG